MRIIAIAMQKGGVGKSTLVRSLAVAGTEDGLNVLALDMDAQQSTRQWRDRRDAALPLVIFTTEIDLGRELDKARAAGCDLVLIDTPPARSTEAPAAVEAADLVLMPCSPDIEAYEQLPRTLRLARTTGKPAAVVLTMATPNSRSEEETAKGVFAAIGAPMVPAVIHRLKAHRDASREGVTPQELEPDGKAALEIATLWQWVCAELHIGTNADVHNSTSARLQKRSA
jgi:chromosome partitioning protein